MLTFDDEREYAIWLDAGYTCPGCGCDYRYRFKVGVLGDSEEEATGRARRKVLSKGLRDIPCPECGRVTAPNHRYRNPVIAVVMAAFCVVVAVVALGFWQTHLFKITAGAV